ncbi:(2Fe-2S)-binding protein [Nitrospina watsonii]|uniref:Fer2_BFD domain-containing protein n=1 Tax=Nitrospina watsonii TaxID=1323948 RepID=A0ABM9HDX2_9BACT|nr:(2Fe-2S)-binding protein [Nitrospina watsonii]CAI2718369.1 Fer2_BFD domain-containing protein [Nitrospina watsonii]
MASSSPDEEIICQCFQVSDKAIKKHIRDEDLQSIEEITAACGAGGGCQSCHMLLQLFLDQHHKHLKPAAKPDAPRNGEVKKRGIFSKLFARY